MTEPASHPAALRAFVVLVATAVLGVVLVWAFRAFGPDSVAFAFVVVWAPMAWLGSLSRVVRPRLPDAFHRLRPFELEGRLYERLGVRAAKAVVRRGVFARFNPDLHLPSERTPERLVHLDQRMRDAEAAHSILFVVGLLVAVNAFVRGWWLAGAATVVFDAFMNGYPVMLQRYNRARLAGVRPE